MEVFSKIVGAVVIGLLVAFLIIVLLSYPVMLLWNALMPVLFDLPTVTFWQAMGLMILANFLFGKYGASSSKS